MGGSEGVTRREGAVWRWCYYRSMENVGVVGVVCAPPLPAAGPSQGSTAISHTGGVKLGNS